MMESEPGSTILSPPWMKTCRCHRREAWELWNMSRHRQIWMVAPASRMSPFLPKGGITASPSIPYVTHGTLSSCPSTLSRASWGLGCKEPQGGKQGQAGRRCWGHVSPTVLRAQQAVEDLLHHDGVELDEFRQGLDHLFLRGKGREGRPDVPLLLRQAAQGPVRCFPPPTPRSLGTGLSPLLSEPGSAPASSCLLCHSFPGPIR